MHRAGILMSLRWRTPRSKSRAAGALLAIGGLILLATTIPATSSSSGELTYGVSHVDGDPGIAIHWVLCPGVAARTVDLGGYVSGSQRPTSVPVLWQIRSDAAPTAEPRVETFTVGQTPDGYYETVRYAGRLPSDLVVISSPPGGASSMNGMSFQLADLPREGVYRGTYETVSVDQFARDGLASCSGGGGTPGPRSDLGLLALGLGGLLVAGRARPTAVLVGATVAIVAIAGVLPVVAGRPLADSSGVAQASSAFVAGAAEVPAGRHVLLDLSPDTAAASPDGAYVARITAPRSYSFVVQCDGPSLQIGEGAGITDGATGGRQVIGCATPEPVRGVIADRTDRTQLVEIVVNPNGIRDWRVVVIEGPGSVGPFDEP
jgi:hypothetical protein